MKRWDALACTGSFCIRGPMIDRGVVSGIVSQANILMCYSMCCANCLFQAQLITRSSHRVVVDNKLGQHLFTSLQDDPIWAARSPPAVSNPLGTCSPRQRKTQNHLVLLLFYYGFAYPRVLPTTSHFCSFKIFGLSSNFTGQSAPIMCAPLELGRG